MKVDTYTPPKSSFLGMPKDTSQIINKIMSNQTLLKLLYYNGKDWQLKPNLTSAQRDEMLTSRQIDNSPQILIDKEDKTYLRITFDAFTPNDTNTFYRDYIVEVKIICHFDNWHLSNYELRPYRVAGEIDAMLDNQHFSGIGILRFIGGDQDVYDQEFGGVTLRYLAIHGNEDKVNPLE